MTHTLAQLRQWSGSPCPLDPDNYWVDDETGERVNAITGERTQYTPEQRAAIAAEEILPKG
jgi:hypothetical protein